MPAWDSVDHVLALDPGQRGIGAFFVPGGAQGAARALAGARRVLIVTGFAVAGGCPETDGPPGAAVLGRALRRLGARVRYVTDPPNVRVLRAALAALGERTNVIVYPEAEDAAPALLARERPTHLVAIERPGRVRDGRYLNMRGVSVGEWNLPLDSLFVEAMTDGGPRLRPARPVTIGVGDGGNEIGMGTVRAKLRRQGALMARIASVVPADHLVVAGVSNWGAYGITAQLARHARRALLHSPADERRMVTACVRAGAVDGVTRRRAPTVDGLSLPVHGAVIELLRLIERTPAPANGGARRGPASTGGAAFPGGRHPPGGRRHSRRAASSARPASGIIGTPESKGR